MKTLRFLSVAAVVAMMSTGMGFPTDLTDKGKSSVKKSANCASEKMVTMVYDHTNEPAKLASLAVEDEPVEEMMIPVLMASSTENITIKVFDIKGALVVSKQVSMGEFLSKGQTSQLPQGSTFVMFHNQTAYYFLEDADVQN